MKTISRKVLLPHGPDRAPLCGFVGYVHPDKPVLLRRIGYEIANDIHDDFADQTSADNGRTWSELRPSLGKEKVEGGYICHTENAIQLLPDGRLIHFTNDKFEVNLEGCDLNNKCQVRITVGSPEEISRGGGERMVSDFGLPQGLCVSFLTPMIDTRGRVLAPVQWQRRDADGTIRRRGFPGRKDLPDVMCDVWEVGLLIGEAGADGRFHWRRAGPVPYDFNRTSRGACEPTITELPGGRLAMVIRGSNAHWHDKPGYKWLTFSDDGGETWSPMQPLACDDGSILESSATGSAFFRSATDGRLYWIGNLCTEGRRPTGNMPRSPLHLVRMREDPLAIERDSITVIDRAREGEHPDTQHSNFKFYQDRATGDVVIHLTRYGQRGYDHGIWIRADLYEYRVALV